MGSGGLYRDWSDCLNFVVKIIDIWKGEWTGFEAPWKAWVSVTRKVVLAFCVCSFSGLL